MPVKEAVTLSETGWLQLVVVLLLIPHHRRG